MKMNGNLWESEINGNQWRRGLEEAAGGRRGDVHSSMKNSREPHVATEKSDTSPSTAGTPFTASQKKVSTPKAQPNWGNMLKCMCVSVNSPSLDFTKPELFS